VAIPDIAGRQVLWITLAEASGAWTDRGLAPLQLAFEAP
jgi:hypothetical protein